MDAHCVFKAVQCGQDASQIVNLPMVYASKIILHTPISDVAKLDSFVEACLADRVYIISVVGPDAAQVEDLIDEIVVGDGSDDSRFVMTSAHAGESLNEVYEFLSTCRVESKELGSALDQVEEVRL